MAIRRRTFSLQSEVDANLTYIHRKMGIAKSALVNELLAEPVEVLAELMAKLPDIPTEQDLIRLRGQSVDVVRHKLAQSGINLSRENIASVMDRENMDFENFEESGS